VPPVTGQLALLAFVGDLVIAIDASAVASLRHTVDVAARRVEHNLYAIELDDETIPGWDLGELFELGACDASWVIVKLPAVHDGRRFGLRVGRCTAVQRLPVCHAIPPSLFRARAGAIAAGFSSPEITEQMAAPSGVVLDLSQLLSAHELSVGARLRLRTEAILDRVT
jgi:hypothetical protein